MAGAFGAGTRNWRSTIWGELLAELIGTATLIAFGDGVVAMAVAALNQSGRGTAIFMASGDWLLITWGWAMAVAMAVYVAGGISGAHINPAVTLAVAVRGQFPWVKVVPYWIAQLIGGFIGAWIVFWIYGNAIGSYEAAHNIVRGALGGASDSTATFSIFATFPASYFHGNMIGPFFDQVVGTFFLVLFIFAIVDRVNLGAEANLWPFVVGLAVAAVGMSFGANAGYAINPARDLGPHVFAYIAGWGQVALPGIDNYVWVPIVGPLVGGAIATVFYEVCIARVLQARREAAGPEPAASIEPGQYRDERRAGDDAAASRA